MQLLPPIELRRFVKHYLWLQRSAAGNDALHIFGDGNPGIAFCCDGRLFQDPFHRQQFPQTFAYGQIRSHRCIYAAGDVGLLIVVLQPFALSGLLHITGSALTDVIIDGQDLLCHDHERVYTQLIEAGSLHVRIQALDRLLGKLFLSDLDAGQLLVSATLDYITKMDGRISSTGLVRFTGYGERHLEKKFKEHVGFSPMKFARVTRMLNYIKLLDSAKENLSLTQQACQAGFFDQAHLNHDFKKLTGMTPTVFSTLRHPLALNFFTIPETR